MERVVFPCGREKIEVRFDPAWAGRVQVLESAPSRPLADPAATLAQALANPLAGPPLAELARGKRRACLVVSDVTRPAPNRIILPALLDALNAAGLRDEQIFILVATGMHRPNLGPELAELVGPEVLERVEVVNHDCRDRAGLVQVALVDGAALEINRRYVQADLKILTGLIEPHPFAGFSGGGKSVLPGLASLETMKFMHSFALVAHPGLGLARVAGNPFREYIDLACAAAGADFLVNAVIDRARRVTGWFVGEVRAAFLAGARAAAEQAVVRVPRRAQAVVTTGGGHPLDATLYQSSKGLASAKGLLAQGGTLLWVAGCAEGLGGAEFRRMVQEAGGPAGFRARHADPANFVLDQWGAQCYFQALAQAGRVGLYSPGVAADQARSFGLTKIEDLQAALAEAALAGELTYLLPEGPYLVGVVD